MKRVEFKEGFQKSFILNTKSDLNLNWRDFARLLKVNESTLSKSYCFELSTIPYSVFKKITLLITQSKASVLKRYFAYIINDRSVIGRKVLGETKKKFSPINIKFRRKIIDLDCSTVAYSSIDKKKEIVLPEKLTPELAEEIGMHLGDGFLSNQRYDFRLKGNQHTEKEYYKEYIAPLYKKLFNIEVILKDFISSYGFEISSRAIWEFKTKVIGIQSGRKDCISLPEILKVNDQEILASLVRGLFDTDGCISFKSKYGYKKYYPVVEINLISKNLITDIAEILFMLGLNPSISLKSKYGRITLSGISSLKRYEKLVGWRSPKNLNKVSEWKNKYKELYSMADVA